MQGFNMGRYMPPDSEGQPTFNKSHPLGSRARHLQTKGALIVRFEMPFATWCTTCKPETIIGQGVRFNAEKKKVGNYYSTPIWAFRIKHTICGGWIEIRTDPGRAEYIVTEGGRRRDYGVNEDGTKVGEILVGRKEGDDGMADPFAKIEGKVEDKRVVDEAKSRILELQKRQERDWEDPYAVSRRLRRGFRVERKSLERKERGKEMLRDKMSLPEGIEIVDEVEEDGVRAGMVEFGVGDEGRGVRAKPMFVDSSLKVGNGADDKKSRSKGAAGKRKTADVVAERKALFRSELTGNTRAAVDPFLKAGDTWEPELKRRKPSMKAEGKKDGGGGDTQVASNGALETLKEPATKSQGASNALVDYGSDSE
ncbi:CWC16 protein [Aspergillus karnatakaensis]|uniref:Saf4/Yju2 family protein n=1 Tax=Aspergillus karnatakaensis TaxID=1810916 RepID=UPI003CCC9593